ncbi:MAG: flagellar basal body P-ring formation chaperone FlgA [Holosporales bacterium]|jgi:flagella basal body P-ring formation protein FlgA|nr:flagellar basal body P-ring formation chaperone FlgA [Holosporales bacterium]
MSKKYFLLLASFSALLPCEGPADIAVSKSEVYLSDLFELPSGVQDVMVMPAPAPEGRQEISVAFLRSLAERYHLSCEDLHTVWIQRQNVESFVTSVPLLKHPKQKGERIDAKDIVWRELPNHSVKGAVIRDTQELQGKVARNFLREGVPLRATNIQRPVLVRKNASVTLRVKMRNLLATDKGKALEDGGQGDTIRVVNTKSGKVVEGTVSDGKTVDVTPV